ncbi:DUF2752 domain-containing protein [Pedobacter cryoconitis]|uniref:DUF2752 domain-containing protein n=1 Tax=Pedobacter cryoconitis TaxID=188932 RepID=A0A7X0MJT6_9SPHI|nr:DUF2752 domain-containing protein [Pedobacter cryoconitis]MBB6499803.1 hypothetical protein [Pedobacter cryoconitis]
MPKIFILSAFSFLLEKADHYLLPCPFKYLTGYDCPGCGFQRSLLALLKGNFQESFHLYPPTVPILLTLIIGLSANYFWGSKSKILINVLFMITGSIIMISYLFKIFTPVVH